MIDCADDKHYVSMYVCIFAFDRDLESKDFWGLPEEPELKELAKGYWIPSCIVELINTEEALGGL